MNSCDKDFCIDNRCHDECCTENHCFDECCIDEECALATVLQSVAMQEASLASILYAESEKIRKAICVAKCIDELVAINESTAQTICAIKELENILKEKASFAIEELRELRCKNNCR